MSDIIPQWRVDVTLRGDNEDHWTDIARDCIASQMGHGFSTWKSMRALVSHDDE